MKYLVAISKSNGLKWAKKLQLESFFVISELTDLENPVIDYRKEKDFIFIEGYEYGTPEVVDGKFNPFYISIAELVEERMDNAKK